MQRRAAFKTLMAAALGGLAARAAAAEDIRGRRVVYHFVDADKVAFALGNMRNHHEGGPPDLSLAAVAHGPALAVFQAKTANATIKQQFAAALQVGDVFYACSHTLAAHGWTLDDLLSGFKLAAKGGVVELADLQAQGFLYLRP